MRIVHVSDTHFAAKADAQRFQLQLSRKAPASDLGRLAHAARNVVIASDGCTAHEPRLFKSMLDELERLSRSDSPPDAVVHSGDITQAGQLGSLEGALDAIRRHIGKAELLAIPGNHDVWPEDFPAFAPARTALQHARIRMCGLLPSRYGHRCSPGALLEWLLLDSAVADALLNTTALGSMDMDLGSTLHWCPQIDPSAGGQTRLRAAVMHHPPADLQGPSTKWWRKLQASSPISGGMVLLDAASARSELVNHGVSLVMCGHEHQPPSDPALSLQEDARLLVLQAGCPSLQLGAGNHDDPQISIYDIEENGSDVELSWFIGRLSPMRWTSFARYRHDGARWHQLTTPPLPRSLAGKPRAPTFGGARP